MSFLNKIFTRWHLLFRVFFLIFCCVAYKKRTDIEQAMITFFKQACIVKFFIKSSLCNAFVKKMLLL